MTQKPIAIFVCLHGAAKSIVAATYFNKIAAETGREMYAVARGLEPDLGLSDATVNGLLHDGLAASELRPQKLLLDELVTAQRIISFCELPEAYRGKSAIEYWEDVPPVSESYEIARDAILVKLKEMMQGSI